MFRSVNWKLFLIFVISSKVSGASSSWPSAMRSLTMRLMRSRSVSGEAVRREREDIAQFLERWAVIYDGAEFDFDMLIDEIRARNDHPEQSGPHSKGESDEN